MRGTYLVAGDGNHLASARSVGVELSDTLDWPCLPPFPAPYPGVIRCRTVFHCYTCTVPKGPEGHSGPSASFPGSIGYVGAACSHVPLSADARHAAPAGLLHRTRRNHAQCDGAVPPAQPAGARQPIPRAGFSSEDQVRLEGGQAEIPAADRQGPRCTDLSGVRKRQRLFL